MSDFTGNGTLVRNGVLFGGGGVVVTSNPNLLDNPWFTVNQRGITSWSDEVQGYSADRWRHDGTATGNITNGVYTCNLATYQPWEDDRVTPLLGKTFTLSWILSDGSIGFETETLPSALTSEYVWPFTNNYVQLGLKSGNLSQIGRILPNVAVKAVKLELGSISTLAHDTAPNYQQELAKCQRYFYKSLVVNTNETVDQCQIFTKVVDTNVVWCNGFRFPTRMRTTPAITTKSIRPANGAYMPISNPSVSYSITQDGVTSSNFVEANYIDGLILYFEIEASADL